MKMDILEEPNKILLEMKNFCKTLYSSQISEDTFNASALPFQNCNSIKILDGEQQKTFEGLTTEEECLSAFKQLKIKRQVLTDSLWNFFICV